MPFWMRSKKNTRATVPGMMPEGVQSIFQGSTLEELKKFTTTTASQLSDHDHQLIHSELLKGETVLGIDHEGKLLRIVSVAKPILYDIVHGELLVEVLQTKIGTVEGVKVKGTGISEKFNPTKESSRDACVRALAEELHWKNVMAETFSKRCFKVIETVKSDKFPGLKSEYHLYVHMLIPAKTKQLQSELIPRLTLNRVDENCALDPKSLWFAWISTSGTDDDIHHFIQQIASSAGFPKIMANLEEPKKFGTAAQAIRSQVQKANDFLGWYLA